MPSRSGEMLHVLWVGEESREARALLERLPVRSGGRLLVHAAPSVAAALDALGGREYHAVLLAPDATDAGAPDVPSRLHAVAPDAAVIWVGGDDEERSPDVIDGGADDWLRRREITAEAIERVVDLAARRRRRQSEIVLRTRQLEDALRRKAEVLASMAHELKNPLNTITLFAGLVLESARGRLTDEERGWLSSVNQASFDMTRVIDDLLELTKAEAGRLTVHCGMASLPELLIRVVEAHEPLAREMGLELSLELEEGLPPTILTDGGKLRQILGNLVTNALKFTSRGYVRIRAARVERPPPRVELRGSGLAAVAISVEDTGRGIAADRVEKVFEPFWQERHSHDQAVQGCGLGLSISRQLARLLGGEVCARSREGVGSTFTLYLPAKLAGAIRASAAEEKDSSPVL